MTKEEAEAIRQIYKAGLRHIIPPHMHDGLTNYMEYGLEPGSFLLAVLCNDFAGAVTNADHINIQALLEWAHYVYFALPSVCRGDVATVSHWMKIGGLRGMQDKDDAAS